MIIAISNQKGGVGKTTPTHNLGVELAANNKRVLEVDADGQSSLTISFGKEPVDFEHSICDIFKRDPIGIEDCIYNIKDNLDIIPSNLFLASMELELTGRTAREQVLARALKKVEANYDYILIDCPPQLSILTLNALAAADKVLIPCQPTYLSYRGLDQLENTINDIRELVNPELEIMGVIATLYKVRVKDQNEILHLLQEKYNVIGIIRETSEAVKGIYDGLAVVERNPKLPISQEYKKIAEYIMSM